MDSFFKSQSYASSRRAFLAAAALLVGGAIPPALAAGGDARAFVDTLGQDVQSILKDQAPVQERQKKFRELFTKAFDTPSIGRFVLGRHWAQASADDQQKFLNLFRDYVAAIYAQQFANYQGQTFRTVSARDTGDGESLVQSQIERQGQSPLHVAFKIKPADGALKIFDVSVEDVSLIVTKRDEFASVLSGQGVAGVMSRMQVALDAMQKG